MTPLDWQEDAACRGVGSGAFFPGREDVETESQRKKLRAARNRQAA